MPLAVYTTLDDAEAAEALARRAVEARLAASVHVEEVRSVYRWKGEVREGPEIRLLFRTSEAAWPGLAAMIRKSHPYELPALWAVPITEGSPDYLAWIDAETT